MINIANTAGADIVKNKSEIATLLNKAVASGLKASFQYMIASQLVRGNEGSEIAEALEAHHKADMEDVLTITKRVIELEEQPIINFDDVSKISPDFRAPTDVSSIAIVKQTLETQKSAIELYQQIIELTKESEDFVTCQLFKEILTDEVSKEREIANFLDDLTSHLNEIK